MNTSNALFILLLCVGAVTAFEVLTFGWDRQPGDRPIYINTLQSNKTADYTNHTIVHNYTTGINETFTQIYLEVPSTDEGWKLNRTNYYQEGWLATGNVRGIVGVTFTTSHCKRNMEYPLRTNYNLRGHRSDVILVKWNEPYQKLASCDSSGIIFVWIKYEGRWSIELINDRNTPVTHFSWSHDGRMALICYQDGFVLVGSVAGQRYWSSMLNLDATITCGIWTPDDQQVYFGTTQGQIIVMDVHGAMVSQVQLCSDVGITSMSWSCEKFKMEEGEETEPGVTNASKRSFVLAVSFQNGFIYLLKSFDDVSPAHISTGLNGTLGIVMEWSNSRELLAVAGCSYNSPQLSNDGQGNPIYENFLKFYTESGALLYTTRIPNNLTPVSALTWGHNDKRIFIATGTQVHIAWVSRRIASLQLLCRLQIQASISSESLLSKLPLPSRIKTLIGNLFAQTIRCCVPDTKSLREFVSRPPACSTRLHCTMIRHDDDSNLSSGTCYTLYLEYLGGLVPLLKGKRTSKIRPEFVIFDPQVDDLSILSQCSSESSGNKSSSASSQSTSGTGGGRSETSDSEIDDGCRGSPRLQRKRKPRPKRKHFHHPPVEKMTVTGENSETADELAYVDTLPEEIKLVEVTSNIWGTKFKIHGLAKTVPSNLGQVTYKTSLLHLQPRQMTLVITELRDDFTTDPDPNFNPNLFSEDEEDHNASPPPAPSGPRRNMDGGSFPIAPMSPRPNRFTSRLKSNPIPPTPPSSITGSLSSGIGPLARAESYDDEMPAVEITECAGSSKQTIHDTHNHSNSPRPGPSYCSLVTQYSRSSTSSSGQSRHAISPLCCEGSVPTLQSPKNAVAPSDIIFDRPPAAGQTTLMNYSSNNDYSNNMVQVKNAIMNSDQHGSNHRSSNNSHVNPVPLNLNLNLEKLETNKSSTSKADKNAANAKDSKRRDFQFIDAETPTAAMVSPIIEVGLIGIRRVPTMFAPSTRNAIPDSMIRSCSAGYLDSVEMAPSEEAFAIIRRDTTKRIVLIDRKQHQRRNKRNHGFSDDDRKNRLTHSGKSRSLDSCDLLNDTNENITSTNQTKVMPKLYETSETDSDCISPIHQRYNFSQHKSVDNASSDQINNNVKLNVVRNHDKLCPICKKNTLPISPTQTSCCITCRRNELHKKLDASLDSKPPPSPSRNVPSTSSNSTIGPTKDPFRGMTRDNKKNGNGIEITPIPSPPPPITRDFNRNSIADNKKLLSNIGLTNNVAKKKTEVITSYTDSPLFSRKYRYPKPESESTKKKMDKLNAAKTDDDIESLQQLVEVTHVEQRSSVSLHTRTLTTLENIISRIRDLDEGRLTPPSSPQRLPRSSPTSPALSKKKRNQSASPIRHILNSPLLNRRQKKKPSIESSDDEIQSDGTATTNSNGTEEMNSNSKQYRDLETFQKAQLRQKLKRGKIEPNGIPSTSQPAPLRREFVMHNKAPMWNENSQVYQLDFGGRVTQESAKNFQIEFRGKQVMQFGRIDGNAYTLDFQYPFSALQAFAVALANVTQRLK